MRRDFGETLSFVLQFPGKLAARHFTQIPPCISTSNSTRLNQNSFTAILWEFVGPTLLVKSVRFEKRPENNKKIPPRDSAHSGRPKAPAESRRNPAESCRLLFATFKVRSPNSNWEKTSSMCFLTVSSRPCLETSPHSTLRTPFAGHCLGAL